MSTLSERLSQGEILRQAQRFIEDAEDKLGVEDPETLRQYYLVVVRVMIGTLQTKRTVDYYGENILFSRVAFYLQQEASNPFILIDNYARSPEEKWYLVGELLEWATKRLVNTYHSEFTIFQIRGDIKAV